MKTLIINLRDLMNALKHHIYPLSPTKNITSSLEYYNQWEKFYKNTSIFIEANSNTQSSSKYCGCTKNTILAIDDEEICLASIEIILHNTNCSLIKANGGEKALEILQNKPNNIDLILVDLIMPNLHGIEILEIIKNDPSLNQIPVILQTASSNELDIQEALNIGAAECIRKPYTKNTLLESIKRNLRIK